MTDNTEKLVAAYRDETHAPPPHMVARWHDAIDEAAALEQGRQESSFRGWHPASFLFGMAVTAALALGIGIGFIVGDDDAPDEPAIMVLAIPQEDVSVALSRGLRLHFRDSRAQILALDDTTDRSDLVWKIVEDNRLFEAAATRENSPRVARVLRAIEPVLLELATKDLSDDELAALQAQLAFEMNVMLTKLARRSSDDSQTT